MKKILIVEDEIAYVKLLHDQLTEEGYHVIEANDGKRGLEMAINDNPDVILLDIRMPGMDGMTMLDLLRKEKNGKSAKVIILTNLDPDSKTLGSVVKDQVAYYLIKSDIKLQDLTGKIKELLSE